MRTYFRRGRIQDQYVDYGDRVYPKFSYGEYKVLDRLSTGDLLVQIGKSKTILTPYPKLPYLRDIKRGFMKARIKHRVKRQKQ